MEVIYGLASIQSLAQEFFPMGHKAGQSMQMGPLYGLLWAGFPSPRPHVAAVFVLSSRSSQRVWLNLQTSRLFIKIIAIILLFREDYIFILNKNFLININVKRKFIQNQLGLIVKQSWFFIEPGSGGTEGYSLQSIVLDKLLVE